MMNPMPMPSRPAEIPGGAMKAERHAVNSDTGGIAKKGDSFASTLKAVHDEKKAPGDSSNARTTDTRAKQENVETKDSLVNTETMEAASPEKPTEAIKIADMPSGNTNPAGVLHVAGAEQAADLEHPSAESVMEEAPAGEGEGETAAPQTGGPIPAADPSPQTASSGVPPEAAGERAVTAPPPSQAMKASPTNAAVSSPTSSNAAQKQVVEPANPADPIHHGAQDRPEVNNDDGSPSFLKGDGAGGTIRADSAALTGEEKGNSGEDDASDAATLVKLLQTRGKAQQREHSQESTPRPTRAESSTMPGERPTTGEGVPEQQKSTGGVGRETPLTVMHDDPGNTAPRQASSDAALSFSHASPVGKAEMPAPGTGATTTTPPAAERFQQDNFHQLVERAMFTIRGEQSEARIALKPDQLGHVHMRIVTENHLVSIKILTESPVVRDLIDANAHQLKSELQQQGLTVETIEVSVSDDQRDAYRGARQRESFLRQLASQGQKELEEDILPSRKGLRAHMPGRGRAAGIDYFA